LRHFRHLGTRHRFVLSSPTFRRVLRFGIAALALVMMSGIGGKVAAAASGSCADQVVADWYDDGRVGKIYPLACYQQAIKKLPPDVLDYSNAKEDILRALAFARKGEKDPGPSGGSQTAGNNGTNNPGTETTEPPGDSGHPGPEGGTGTDAVDPVDTSGPSSVPIPLLVLGGLALLLLAAGGAGYLSRRSQARRDGGPPGPA
jgi:hypothetical protein